MKKIYLTLASALFFISTYSQGNDCANATPLSATGQFSSVGGTTTNTGDNGGNSTNDVFYIISPATAQTVNLAMCNTSSTRDTKLVVYSDCTLSTIIAENDDGGTVGFDACGRQAKLSFQSDGVSTYIIMVEGADNVTINISRNGEFQISLWYEPAFTLPQTAVGINCTPGVSDPTTLFSEEFDDNSAGWLGDIIVNGHSSGDWEINGNGIHSADTGPSGVDPNTVGSSYMSYESSLDPGDGSTDIASAVSPAIDLSGSVIEDAELSFYMHAYGIRMGTLNVGVGTSSSGPFTNEFSWTGQLQSIETQDWVQVGIDLSGYLNQTIYLEFKMAGSGNFHSDMAIDLIEVKVCDNATVLNVAEEEIVELILYPNPANDIINIKSQDIVDEIRIYNLLGQQLRFVSPGLKQTSIDIANFEVGVYIVKVKIGDQINSYRILKK